MLSPPYISMIEASREPYHIQCNRHNNISAKLHTSHLCDVPTAGVANAADWFCRVDLSQRKVYVLLSNGHIHVWKMHDNRAPTLIAVWDKLTPNHKDLALSIALVSRGSLSPKFAELQGGLQILTSNVDHVSPNLWLALVTPQQALCAAYVSSQSYESCCTLHKLLC